MRRSRLLLGVVVALMLGLGLAPAAMTTTTARAQDAIDWSGWIALQVWDCPSGMTAETFDAWSCWLAEGEYDVQIADAEWTPLLGLGDAVFDGWTHTWLGLPVGPDWAATPYRVVQTSPPAGETVWLSAGSFGADLHVYNFYP